jgi:SET domain
LCLHNLVFTAASLPHSLTLHHAHSIHTLSLSCDSPTSLLHVRALPQARFINHSCDPNCVTQKWHVLGESCIGLFTLRDVKAGEELTFDYNFETVGGQQKECLCGAKSCRRFLDSKKSQQKLGNAASEAATLEPTSSAKRKRASSSSCSSSSFSSSSSSSSSSASSSSSSSSTSATGARTSASSTPTSPGGTGREQRTSPLKPHVRISKIAAGTPTSSAASASPTSSSAGRSGGSLSPTGERPLCVGAPIAEQVEQVVGFQAVSLQNAVQVGLPVAQSVDVFSPRTSPTPLMRTPTHFPPSFLHSFLPVSVLFFSTSIYLLSLSLFVSVSIYLCMYLFLSLSPSFFYVHGMLLWWCPLTQSDGERRPVFRRTTALRTADLLVKRYLSTLAANVDSRTSRRSRVVDQSSFVSTPLLQPAHHPAVDRSGARTQWISRLHRANKWPTDLPTVFHTQVSNE